MGLKLVKSLSAAVLSSVAITGLACDNPPLVQIPEDIGDDGARIQAQTQEYVDAVSVYVECLQAELAAAGGDDAPPLYKAMIVARNNLAVAEVEAVLTVYQDRFGSPAPGGSRIPEN